MKPDDDLDVYEALKAAGYPVTLQSGHHFRWCVWHNADLSLVKSYDWPAAVYGPDGKELGMADDLAGLLALVGAAVPA